MTMRHPIARLIRSGLSILGAGLLLLWMAIWYGVGRVSGVLAVLGVLALTAFVSGYRDARWLQTARGTGG